MQFSHCISFNFRFWNLMTQFFSRGVSVVYFTWRCRRDKNSHSSLPESWMKVEKKFCVIIRLESTLPALCGGSFVIILLNSIRVLQCNRGWAEKGTIALYLLYSTDLLLLFLVFVPNCLYSFDCFISVKSELFINYVWEVLFYWNIILTSS